MAIQGSSEVMVTVLNSRLSDALLMTLQDVLESLSATSMPERQQAEVLARQRVRLSLGSKAFLHVAVATMGARHDKVLRDVLGKQEEQWQKVIQVVGTLLAPPALYTASAWRTFVQEHQPLRDTLENGLLHFMEAESLSLRVAAIQALLRIAKTMWTTDGAGVLRSLTAKVRDSSVWLELIPKRKVDFERILQLATAILAGVPFDGATGELLVFLRSLCVLSGLPQRENQDRVLEAWVSLNRNLEAGVRDGEGRHTPSHIFFRAKDGRTEVSASTGTRRRLWRSLRVFFLFEPRQELKDFLSETLRLWAALARGNNVQAIKQLTSYLSFDQVGGRHAQACKPDSGPERLADLFR